MADRAADWMREANRNAFAMKGLFCIGLAFSAVWGLSGSLVLLGLLAHLQSRDIHVLRPLFYAATAILCSAPLCATLGAGMSASRASRRRVLWIGIGIFVALNALGALCLALSARGIPLT